MQRIADKTFDLAEINHRSNSDDRNKINVHMKLGY